ncbi:MAG: FHA domain-containing protein [Isosphaeraceae bacterium]
MSFRLAPLIKGSAPIIAIHRPVLMIGRHLECDVRIDQPKISRRHCCLAMAYDRVLVRDLGSRNKIRVNGQVVDEARLQAGDELAIGPLLYRLEQVEERREVQAVVSPSPKRVPTKPPAAPAPPPPVHRPADGPSWSLDDADSDLIPLDDI